MDSSTDIRPYTSTDENGVVALWREVFPDEDGFNDPSTIISRKLTVQSHLFLVAVWNDEVIGTVLAGFDGVRGWIHKLAVHPEHRRAGLASMLMRQAEAGLHALGCPKINLQVRASNAGVVQFYESIGYNLEDRASLGKQIARTNPIIRLDGYLDVPETRLDQVLEALDKHIMLTRAEPGCLEFQVQLDQTIAGRLLVSERFESEAAFEYHQARTAASDWAEVTAGIQRHYQISRPPN